MDGDHAAHGKLLRVQQRVVEVENEHKLAILYELLFLFLNLGLSILCPQVLLI